jgi:hypothetical protein
LVLYLELTLFSIPLFILIATWSSAAALVLSGSLWLLAQIHPNLLPRMADHSYFNPIAWQFVFCIGMFVGTRYNSDEMSLEIFRKRPWVLLACILAGMGLLYQLTRSLAHHQLLNLGTLALSDATLSQMKENLSATRLLHFLGVAFLVAICVRPSSPILSLSGARAIIKSGGSSFQVFCLGAILTVMLNLFVAVERPGGTTRVILDCATILLIASVATALMRLRPDHRQLPNIRPTRVSSTGTALSSEGHAFAGRSAPRQKAYRTASPGSMIAISGIGTMNLPPHAPTWRICATISGFRFHGRIKM